MRYKCGFLTACIRDYAPTDAAAKQLNQDFVDYSKYTALSNRDLEPDFVSHGSVVEVSRSSLLPTTFELSLVALGLGRRSASSGKPSSMLSWRSTISMACGSARLSSWQWHISASTRVAGYCSLPHL